MNQYRCMATQPATELSLGWTSALWCEVPAAAINQFRPESSDHRPTAAVKMIYNSEGLYGLFRIADRFVRSIRTRYNDSVCKDSCVEFFVQPRADAGYFNFEFNCGGTLHLSYVTDPKRIPPIGKLRQSVPVPAELAARIRILHSLPLTVEPEIATPQTWELAFFIPYLIMTPFVGPVSSDSGQVWRANFYKCGDETSHPHWAAWSAVDRLNFHLPRCFGELVFG
jgi:hypothetical protein